jgi:hypothetical protein
VDLKPGILLTPRTLLAARVGAAFNEFKIRSLNHYDNSDGFIFPVADLRTHNHKCVTGLRLGLGIDQNICQGLFVTADYIYWLS